MSTYSELQQELMILWKSRMKDIDGLKETGRQFRMSKPMHEVMNSSQRNYRILMIDMKKQMRSMRKQMSDLQKEMNRIIKLLNAESQKKGGDDLQLSK